MKVFRNIYLRQDGQLAILVNYKCGFATLHNALVLNRTDSDFAYADAPEQDVKAASQAVLFVRDPAARLRSFFRNWIIDKAYGTDDKQHGYEFSKNWLTARDYAKLTAASGDEKNTAAFIEFYINRIGPAFWTDQHTAPQWRLLQNHNLDLSDLSAVLNYRENTTFLRDHCGLDVAVRNVSLSSGPDPLDCPAVTAFCKTLYARDYDMFGDQF
ncbi:MAG: hypothetical protein AB8B51_06035 [Sedimentitalea sp.]